MLQKKSSFKKDMLLVVKDNTSAVAKLSSTGKIVPLEEFGKVIFWNHNPGPGLYLVNAYLNELDAVVKLGIDSFEKIKAIEKIKKELEDYRWIKHIFRELPMIYNAEQKSEVLKETVLGLFTSVQKSCREVSEMQISKEAKRKIFSCIKTTILLNFESTTKEKLNVVKVMEESTKY